MEKKNKPTNKEQAKQIHEQRKKNTKNKQP